LGIRRSCRGRLSRCHLFYGIDINLLGLYGTFRLLFCCGSIVEGANHKGIQGNL
jgi:hypothetical protein